MIRLCEISKLTRFSNIPSVVERNTQRQPVSDSGHPRGKPLVTRMQELQASRRGIQWPPRVRNHAWQRTPCRTLAECNTLTMNYVTTLMTSHNEHRAERFWQRFQQILREVKFSEIPTFSDGFWQRPPSVLWHDLWSHIPGVRPPEQANQAYDPIRRTIQKHPSEHNSLRTRSPYSWLCERSTSASRVGC
jgi:hypothetical protein